MRVPRYKLAHPSARAAQRGERGYAAWYVRVGAAMKNSSWAAVGTGMVGLNVVGEALALRRSWLLCGRNACQSLPEESLPSLVCCHRIIESSAWAGPSSELLHSTHTCVRVTIRAALSSLLQRLL